MSSYPNLAELWTAATPIAVLAERYGRCESAVHYAAKRAGLGPHPRDRRRPEYDTDKFRADWHSSKTIAQMSEEYGAPIPSIFNAAMRRGFKQKRWIKHEGKEQI